LSLSYPTSSLILHDLPNNLRLIIATILHF
jgi:hypothetical protein